MILTEGFWTCMGALIGATIGGFITLTVSKKTIKIELNKIKMSFLVDKLRKLESIKDFNIKYIQEINQYNEQQVIDDNNYLMKVFENLAHYFF